MNIAVCFWLALSLAVKMSPTQQQCVADAQRRLGTVCMRPVAALDTSPVVQERRVIEYVSLGDFQTAVGFLLASTPEKSIRYYRDALCTLALAVSALT